MKLNLKILNNIPKNIKFHEFILKSVFLTDFIGYIKAFF